MIGITGTAGRRRKPVEAPPMIVSACPRPYDARRVDIEVPHGATVAEIVAIAFPDPALRGHVEVLIGDTRVAPEWWASVRPKAGAIVSVNLIPGDSGALRIAITVAVVIAAAVATFFAPYGSPAYWAAVGVVFAGSVALALLPPSSPAIADSETSQDSQTYSFGQSRNAFRPGGPVPQLFGDFRFAAPKAGEYVETLGGERYLRVLFVLSTGMVTDPEITIGETDVTEYDNVTVEFKRGWHPDLLTDRGVWDASAGTFPAAPAFGDRWTVGNAGTVDGTYYATQDTIIRNWIGAGTTAGGWDLNHDKPHALFPSDVYSEGMSAELTYNNPVVRTSQTNADELAVTISFPALIQYNSKGKKETASVTFKIEQSPAGAGTWSQVGTFTVRGKRQTSVHWGHRWYVQRSAAPSGQFDIRVTRQTVANPTSDNTYLADSFLTQLDTFTTEDPLGGNVGFATLALRIRATGQLFGTLDQVFTRCQSVERDWNGAAWVWQPTSRPAAHFRHVLQSVTRAKAPLPDSRVDLDALAAWSDADAAAGRTFDAYIDFTTTEFQILEDIAAAGFAALVLRGTKYAVAVDALKTTPVRLFSPHNTSRYHGRTYFPPAVHGYRVNYINGERGYTADEVIAYADGYDAASAHIIEDREYLGLTTAAANWLRARRDLAEARLRRESHKFNTGLMSVCCERGDKVAFQHYAIAVGLTSARVRAVA